MVNKLFSKYEQWKQKVGTYINSFYPTIWEVIIKQDSSSQIQALTWKPYQIDTFVLLWLTNFRPLLQPEN